MLRCIQLFITLRFCVSDVGSLPLYNLQIHLQYLIVPSIGQADDTILTSNNIHALQCLLQLTLHFYQRYNVELCVEKTKLQAFATPDLLADVEHIKSTSPVNINGLD